MPTQTKQTHTPSGILAMISGHTCGPACWEAREDVCRCECGGKNHGCLRDPNGLRPVRRSKIRGDAYSLAAAGQCADITKQAIELNQLNGCYYYPIAHGSQDFDKCIAKVRPATHSQVETWPELAAYRGPEWIIQGGVYLLWKLETI